MKYLGGMKYKGVGFTENLTMVFLKSQYKQQKFIADAVAHYRGVYKKMNEDISDSKSRAWNMHNYMDETISERLEKEDAKQITCKKSCAFCCYMEVAVTNDEADLLIEFAKEKNIPIDVPRLEKQMNWESASYQDRKCVFLGDDNLCQVYENRPMACRKYFVADDPKKCDTKDYPETLIQRFSVTLAEIIASGIYCLVGSKIMAKALLGKLK